MTMFYILRHGETEWNADHDRYCGITDIALSEKGQEQAKRAADTLGSVRFDAIYCSPMLRARQTVQPIARVQNLSIHTDDRLREIDFGKWEGLTRTEISSQFPEDWAQWNEDPTRLRAGQTGERADEVASRAMAAYKDMHQKHPEGTILVVAHNALNRLFMAASLEMPLRHYRSLYQHNTGISVLEMTDTALRWYHMNIANHVK